MIVFDEQLKAQGLETDIEKWYPGSVVKVTSLRPDTVIKDEAIPALMDQLNQAVFITINVSDFWQQVRLSEKFCLVCFALTTSEISQISDLLRKLLRHPEFDAKTKRAGKAIRITKQGIVSWYSASDRTVRFIENF